MNQKFINIFGGWILVALLSTVLGLLWGGFADTIATLTGWYDFSLSRPTDLLTSCIPFWIGGMVINCAIAVEEHTRITPDDYKVGSFALGTTLAGFLITLLLRM